VATVNKNFRIKNGLVVEGSTATVNGQNVLTETGSDQYILNLIGGETLVKSVNSSQLEVSVGGELSVKANVFDAYGSASQALSDAEDYADNLAAGKQDTLSAGTGITISSNTVSVTANTYDAYGAASQALSDAEDYVDNALNSYTPTSSLDTTIDGYGYLKSADLAGYATETYADTAASNAQDAAESYADGLAVNYDAAGAASTAEANANTYTDNAINGLDTDDIEEGTTNKYYSDSLARGAISAGTGISYNSGTGVISVDNTIATESYVDTAISNLVDGAPGLLDTLNEIAAAINDDENYFTTVSNAIAAKQDTLTAGANIDITSNTISVTGLDTDDVAEGTNLYFTDARARSAVDGTDRSFTSVEINEVSKEVAATTGNIATAAATTAYAWAKADYRSAKFMVKIKNGSHTEVSELLVTLDTSDSVYLTEYGMSSTSGTSLGTITADVSGSDVRIRVTPANNNSEVIVAGTLLI
jgi:hypothetical protein